MMNMRISGVVRVVAVCTHARGTKDTHSLYRELLTNADAGALLAYADVCTHAPSTKDTHLL